MDQNPILNNIHSGLVLKVLDNLSSPIMVAKREDGKLNTLYLNKSFIDNIGYTIDEIPDFKSMIKLVFPQAIYRVAIKSEWFVAMENALSSGAKTVSNIARLCNKKGDYYWFDLRTTIDEELHFIVFLDINQVNEDNQKLRNELIIKDNVLSIISHDLRSPFASIKGLADLLEFEVKNKNFENVKEYVHLVKKTASNALSMLDELLISARMEVREFLLNQGETNIKEMIADVIEKFRLDIVYKGQTVEIISKVDKSLLLDSTKTEQIITNLFSNALKYSDNGKKITIGATYINGMLTFWVEDEGLGFTDKDRMKMFGKFQKLSAKPTGGEKSVGLGLYICKVFAELQNGRIFAESKGKDLGSKFTVEIPTEEYIKEK